LNGKHLHFPGLYVARHDKHLTMAQEQKNRAPRNRTIDLSAHERLLYGKCVISPAGPVSLPEILNHTINQDLFAILEWLPRDFVDLLFIDPPYNIAKSFNGTLFQERPIAEYQNWFESWFPRLLPTLKPTASVYICGDWRSSAAIHLTTEKYLKIQNRITWEREKGRGAKANWKNCAEDIWFCSVSKDYTFNIDAVKLNRRVLAPYRDHGRPKDWRETDKGNYRITYPSNLWTDLTVPFWSMPENTDHPTQKPEKLLAKIILASSNPSDVVLDPFAGAGTTCVVAKKLGRRYIGIEIDKSYCCLAEKRLALVECNSRIQGFSEGVFWERNASQRRKSNLKPSLSAKKASFPGQNH